MSEQESLRQNLSELFLLLRDPIIVIGHDGLILFSSPAWEAELGSARPEANRTNVSNFIHPDDLQRVRARIGERLEEERAVTVKPLELRLQRADGAWGWFEAVANPRQGPSGRELVVSLRNVDERKAFEKALQQQARTDALTGLLNRGGLFACLENLVAARSRRDQLFGLLYVDLDGFKCVNDDHGHEIGDSVLVETAQRLVASIASHDVVARIGGDEFVLVLTEASSDADCRASATAVRAAISKPFEIPEGTVAVSASVGRAVWTPGTTPDALLRSADQRMFSDKRSAARTGPPRSVAR